MNSINMELKALPKLCPLKLC